VEFKQGGNSLGRKLGLSANLRSTLFEPLLEVAPTNQQHSHSINRATAFQFQFHFHFSINSLTVSFVRWGPVLRRAIKSVTSCAAELTERRLR